jgi:hypothetical protein
MSSTDPADPGPRSAPEHAREADALADGVLQEVEHLNRLAVEKWFRDHPQPPAVQAALAFRYSKLVASKQGRHAATAPRKNSLQAEIRTINEDAAQSGAHQIGVFEDVRQHYPQLLDKVRYAEDRKAGRKRLSDAIYKANKAKR